MRVRVSRWWKGSALLMIAVSLSAQTATTPIIPTPTGAVIVGIGAEKLLRQYYTTIDLGVQLSGSHIYSISTLETRGSNSTVRTGLAWIVKHNGPIALIAMADAGITTGTVTNAVSGSATSAIGTATLGNVGGGILVRYDLGDLYKPLAGWGIVGGFRETAVSGNSVTPEFIVKLSYYIK